MRTSPVTTATQTDWSFRVGLAFVILFAAGQLFGVGYYVVRKPARATGGTRVASVPQPTPVIAPTEAPTAPPVASVAPSIAASVAPSPAATAAIATVDRLVKDAVALRERGDNTTALARLHEAEQREPKNATVLSEMATTYESMQMLDRSNETWRRVEDLGPSAGSAYAMAELKLHRGPAATPAATAPPAESSPAAAPSVAPSAVASASRSAAEGVPEGSTFGISEVLATESPDPDADTNLMLRISVKKRPNAVVDHTKVKIQVFFYDTVNDKDIKLTDAEVNYEWLTPNHDWAGPNPEVLAVTYLRPKNMARSQEEALSAAAGAVIPGKKNRVAKPASPDAGARRAYLGYIVRVYYNDKLQAVRADPTKLLNLFPAPNTPSSP